jgi:D-serine deaminase-like pyridoxal phosphate-dependent protein
MTPNLDHIDTPALLLDAKKLERNCRRMRSIVHGHGVALRPHVKTAKSVEVAQVALDAPTGAITVSTLREAEYFFDHGFRDILYAVGMAPGKLRRVVDLIKRGARVSAIVDSVEAGTSIARAVASSGVRIPTLIEIDSDGHRAGVTPEDPRLLAIAEALGGSLQGVMTHAGDSYNCESTDAIKRVAERERAAVVRAAQRLREAGHRCDVVSVGSTPTATFAESLDGVTEVRTGVYMFQDLVMAGLGVCSLDEIALSVLGTVIGHQHDKGWVITDAGWMALSRDRGTARQKMDQGYGVVCDVAGQPIEGVIVSDANQEHGIVARRDGAPLDVARFPIGSRLRILPNHACAMAAQHCEYKVVRDDEPIEVWERFNGW